MKPAANRDDAQASAKLIKSAGLKVNVSSGSLETLMDIILGEKKISFDEIKSLTRVCNVNRI